MGYNKDYKRPIKKCSICGEDGLVQTNGENGPICHTCYQRTYKTPEELCSICGQIKNVFNRNPEAICRGCYMNTYEPPLHRCSKCLEEKPAHKILDNGDYLCNGCYSREHPRPLKVCDICGNLAPAVTKNPIRCQNCYGKFRSETDPTYSIKVKLCKRVSKFIRLGRLTRSQTSLIDYGAIVKHIGLCPGNIDDYQIDHIFPLAAFDLTNPQHVTAAFAPENHQWLLAKVNMSKKAKYNKMAFEEYLKKYANSCS